MWLDANIFPDELIADNGITFDHYAPVSLLIHLPLMLLPAALVLAFGLKRLPDHERTAARMTGAWALVIIVTVPALIPELSHHPHWLPLRLPV